MPFIYRVTGQSRKKGKPRLTYMHGNFERIREVDGQALNQAIRDFAQQERAKEPYASLLTQVHEVFVAKKAIDIDRAEIRARKCGCHNCHKDAERTREWYA